MYTMRRLCAAATLVEIRRVAATSHGKDPSYSRPPSEVSPPGRKGPSLPMFIAGVTTLTPSYAATAIVGAQSNRDADKWLFAPLAGPWIALATRDCKVDPCPNRLRDDLLLGGAGVLQGLGAAATIASFFWPRSPHGEAERRSFSIRPGGVGRGVGLSARGTF